METFIKAQKERITKIVSEISTIAMLEALKPENQVKYPMTFEISNSGSNIEVRISKPITFHTIAVADIFNLDMIFKNATYRNKADIKKEVTETLVKLRKIKKLALKYSELNK